MTGARRLIVTADDFGLAGPVNEAIERGHRDGILTAASLMVTAREADDAVDRARRLPGLAVGLHLVLVDGRPALDPAQIPALVGRDGMFHRGPVAAGIAISRTAEARRQMEREARAQIERFLATGLAPDHIDSHHHLHVHPAVRRLVIRLAREYGIRAVRLPREPAWAAWRATGDRGLVRFWSGLAYGPLWAWLRRELVAARLVFNDWMFGLNDAGRMGGARFGSFLANLPDGVTELCLHMATRHWDGPDAWPRDFGCVAEYEAVIDPANAASLAARRIVPTAFRDLARQVGAAA